MDISYGLLVITCFLYGASTLVEDWSEFITKLLNSLFIIFVIVILSITIDDGFFDDFVVNLFLPVIAVILGFYTLGSIGNNEWRLVFAVLTAIGLIATIITTCCGL